ncbi:hypothetical protein ACEE86_13840, partial [Proteus mirabilis]
MKVMQYITATHTNNGVKRGQKSIPHTSAITTTEATRIILYHTPKKKPQKRIKKRTSPQTYPDKRREAP